MKSIEYEGKEKIKKKIPNTSLGKKGNDLGKSLNSGSAARQKKSNASTKNSESKKQSAGKAKSGKNILIKKNFIESQILYEQIFNNSNDMIFIHPIPGNKNPGYFYKVNKAVIKKLGYSKLEIQKLCPADIVIDENIIHCTV